MLKGDARECDGGVADGEGCTPGGRLKSAAAVEKSGRRRAADNERRDVVDVDRGLVENARVEHHFRGADNLNCVSDCFTRPRRRAERVVAGCRVDRHPDHNAGYGGRDWWRICNAKACDNRRMHEHGRKRETP